jgi:hypothetical protein
MAAALGRAEVGRLISLVINNNEAGRIIAAAIRDDECGGELAMAGADVEVGGSITVLRQIREGSSTPQNKRTLWSCPMKKLVF